MNVDVDVNFRHKILESLKYRDLKEKESFLKLMKSRMTIYIN